MGTREVQPGGGRETLRNQGGTRRIHRGGAGWVLGAGKMPRQDVWMLLEDAKVTMLGNLLFCGPVRLGTLEIRHGTE